MFILFEVLLMHPDNQVTNLSLYVLIFPFHLPQTPEDDPPTYTWELTTTAFRVDAQGQLVVAEDTLDRDPPNPGVYNFQVK